MPRKQKDIYEKIAAKEEEINLIQTKLMSCQSELKTLNLEREKIEMNKLYGLMKESNINIEDAMALLKKAK